MEFIREYLDESTGEVVLEYSVTKEEEERLNKICTENNTTPSEIVERFLEKCIDEPDTFAKWTKEIRNDKFPTGTLGKPQCKCGDLVGFYLKPYGKDEEKFYKGTVEIVDSYGTFEQNEEPSYDILVEDFEGTPTLVKHVRESDCYDLRHLQVQEIEETR